MKTPNLTPAWNWLAEAGLNILNLLGSIFLIALAFLLFAVCFFPAIIWKIVVSVKHDNRKIRDILDGTTKFFVAIAIGLDQVGNIAFGGFFNWLFINDEGDFPFGNAHETVSEVLGWNQSLENLTRTGKLMVAILNVIEEEHCLHAMASGLFDAKYKVEHYKALAAKLDTIENTRKFKEKYS